MRLANNRILAFIDLRPLFACEIEIVRSIAEGLCRV